MDVDPRTPVVVGVGTASAAVEACELMTAACEAAARDAGSPAVLGAAQCVLAPQGTWGYHDGARLVADGIGARDARTVVADIGVLQTTLLARAATAIAAGDLDVAVVVGGEARNRLVQARARGETLVDTDDTGAEPDERLQPHGMIVSKAEIDAGLITATSQYALIENARRAADGQTIADHLALLARQRATFAAVAADNPDAWHRTTMTNPERPIAFPYVKADVSQMNVDQAAAILLCSVAAAQAHGVAPDRWVFPHAIAEANVMIPLTQRAALHRSPGFAVVGRAALEHAGVTIDDVGPIDLYSCFPIAVRVQATELGITGDRPVTLTGGMNYAGGPLNNYALQSLVALVRALRVERGATGMATAVSGMITKQGVGLWSTNPPARVFRAIDVSDEVDAATERRPDATGAGPARVVTSTVVFDRGGSAERGIVVTDLDGGRAIATTTDPDTMHSMTTAEWCGRMVELDGAGGFRA